MDRRLIKKIYQKNFSIERAKHNSAFLVKELSLLEEKCLPFQMCHANNEKYFSQVLNNQENICLLLYYKNRLVGFLLAKKYSQAYKELINHDPDLEKQKEGYYLIETIQIHPRFRKKGGFERFIFQLLSWVEKERIKGFCLYARRKNSFSNFVQKRFNGKKIRTVENWLGFGESFDYLEISLNQSLLNQLAKHFRPN